MKEIQQNTQIPIKNENEIKILVSILKETGKVVWQSSWKDGVDMVTLNDVVR